MQIKKNIKYHIKTSGYTDRFLTSDSTIVITHEVNGVTIQPRFNSRAEAMRYLLSAGMTLDEAREALGNADSVHTISATIYTQKRGLSRTISQQDVASIQAYLNLRMHRLRKNLTTEAVNRYQDVLANHPLDEDLLAIVEAQIESCDLHNKRMWGHVNGQAAGQSA